MKQAKLKPLVEFPGATNPWKSECLKCGARVSPRLKVIKGDGGGCQNCGQKVTGIKLRVDEKEATKLFNLMGLKPLVPFQGAGIPWKSQCIKCKQQVSPRYSFVKARESGCRYCAGRAVSEKTAMALLLKNQLQPLEPNKGNKHPWRSIHIPCGNEVAPRYNSLQKGQGPSKYCARLHNAETYRITKWLLKTNPVDMVYEDARLIAKALCTPWIPEESQYLNYWTWYTPDRASWAKGARWVPFDAMITFSESEPYVFKKMVI